LFSLEVRFKSRFLKLRLRKSFEQAAFLAVASSWFYVGHLDAASAKESVKAKPGAAKSATKPTAGDPVDAYIKTVSPKIHGAWKAPETKTAQQVVVSIKISADGKVSELKIKEASGDQAFDDATIESLKTIGQLPPLPPSAKNGLTLDYTFHAGEKNQSTKADNEAYVNAFSRKVNSRWRNPKVERDYQVSVAITADKAGKLVSAKVVKSSGNKVVDEAGLTAAKLAEPYPPMPESLGDKITINYTFQAGPGKDVINKMQFNGVPLPQGDYQISAGGAQLRPLDVDTAINRKLQEREAQAQDRMLSIKAKLTQAENKFGKESIEAAKARHELAKCAVELHDYKEAEAAYSAALSIVEKDAAQAAELQSLLADYAQMYVTTARLKEAEPLLSRACEIGKSGNAGDMPKQRKIMEEYARLLYKLNRTADADAIYKQLRAAP